MENPETIELLKKVAEEMDLAGITRQVVDMETCGQLSVYIQGDLEKAKERPVILTVHDAGSSYLNMMEFFSHPDLANIKSRSIILHVCLFGQAPGADFLTSDFPNLQDIGLELVGVLDRLHVPQVICFGDGAGANICLRFGAGHPTRVTGMILVNGSGGAAFSSYPDSCIDASLNDNNVGMYLESFKKRKDFLAELKDKIKFDVLCVTGSKSKYADDSDNIRSNLTIGSCSVIKIDGIAYPLREAKEGLADALILFCQGLGLYATVARRMSRQLSTEGKTTPTRKLSMEQFDQPNLRRLSLTGNNLESDSEALIQLRQRMAAVAEIPGIQRHIIELENCGPISVYIQGDLEKRSSGIPVFLTVHDIRNSYQSMVEMASSPDMEEIRGRSLFLHVSIFGQAPGSEDLAMEFPSLQNIGLGLVTVLDQLRIPQVVCIGDGVGANICLRFGLCHPTRVHGLFLLNCSAREENTGVLGQIKRRMSVTTAAKYHIINQNNLAKFEEANVRRTEVLSLLADRVTFDVMCVTGEKTKWSEEADYIHSNIKPGNCSVIKVKDCDDPLKEAVEKLADTLILFCQGCGLMPTARRKLSRTMSQSSDAQENGQRKNSTGGGSRKMSMEQFDIPNIRRLSLTPNTS